MTNPKTGATALVYIVDGFDSKWVKTPESVDLTLGAVSRGASRHDSRFLNMCISSKPSTDPRPTTRTPSSWICNGSLPETVRSHLPHVSSAKKS